MGVKNCTKRGTIWLKLATIIEGWGSRNSTGSIEQKQEKSQQKEFKKISRTLIWTGVQLRLQDKNFEAFFSSEVREQTPISAIMWSECYTWQLKLTVHEILIGLFVPIPNSERSILTLLSKEGWKPSSALILEFSIFNWFFKIKNTVYDIFMSSDDWITVFSSWKYDRNF